MSRQMFCRQSCSGPRSQCCGWAADIGNRLTYLDSPVDPYYVDVTFPRLVTPQWVGEDGVEAVIVLAVDDMGSDVAGV